MNPGEDKGLWGKDSPTTAGNRGHNGADERRYEGAMETDLKRSVSGKTVRLTSYSSCAG